MGIVEIKILIDIAQTVVLVVVAIFVWVNGKNTKTNERIDSLEKAKADKADLRCSEQADKIGRIDAEVKHAPGKKDIETLHARITDVNGHVKNIEGKMDGMKNTLHLIEQHLLGASK